jgi:curved DNA-binding protein
MVPMHDDASSDPYKILGLDPTATPQEIKKAFRQIAHECHPDVAKESPAAAERFKKAREAYETLIDPSARARHDRRKEGRSSPLDGFWGSMDGARPENGAQTSMDQGNDLDLEDLMRDFGSFAEFGFGRGAKAPRPEPEPRRTRTGPRPEPGRDIHVRVDVPPAIAERGGQVPITYRRRVRMDVGRELHTIEEMHELRIPPGTRHGETLRVPRMGDLGTGGARPGDLVADIVVTGAQTQEARCPRGGFRNGEKAPDARSTDNPSASKPSTDAPRPLPISVTEALLGGRVEVETPGGRVRLVIPPCTSSGARFRVRGKGEPDADGRPKDIYFEARIVVPSSLDDESRGLVEQFARLNPHDPRENASPDDSRQ